MYFFLGSVCPLERAGVNHSDLGEYANFTFRVHPSAQRSFRLWRRSTSVRRIYKRTSCSQTSHHVTRLLCRTLCTRYLLVDAHHVRHLQRAISTLRARIRRASTRLTSPISPSLQSFTPLPSPPHSPSISAQHALLHPLCPCPALSSVSSPSRV